MFLHSCFFPNSQMVPSLNSKHQEAADTFLIRTPVTGQMTHPIPVWPHLNYILRCCFQVRSHSQAPGSRASTCLSGGLGSSHNRHVWNWDYQPRRKQQRSHIMASPRGEGSMLEEGDHICRSVAVIWSLRFHVSPREPESPNDTAPEWCHLRVVGFLPVR